jgi:hypothetical protein
MKITNPVLEALYKRICEQLEAEKKKQSEYRTNLTKQRNSKKFKGNELEPDKANTIEERVRLKFNLMNK